MRMWRRSSPAPERTLASGKSRSVKDESTPDDDGARTEWLPSRFAEHLDDGAEVPVGVVGGELRVDLGGVAAQGGGRSGRLGRVHGQPEVLVHQCCREPRFGVVF